jgi:hypothetical protein
MKKLLVALPAMLAISACTTTGPFTAAERARCQEMARQMSLASNHDHQAERSGMASPMNSRHDRCRAIARQDAREQSH